MNSNMKRHYRGHTELGSSRKSKESGRRRKGLDDDDSGATVSTSTGTFMRNETSASEHPDSDEEDDAGVNDSEEEEGFESQEEPYPDSETPGPSTTSQYSGYSPLSSPTSQPALISGGESRDIRTDIMSRYSTWASTSKPSSFNDSPAPPSALMGYNSRRSKHVKKEDGR